MTREYKAFQESPPPFIQARPNESNILEWHYVITGPPDTPYHNGQYHGTLTFPADYPFKPPAIRMFTPSGRFRSGMRLCLSISDYHPKTWNPAWSVSTILTGLLSFMVADESTAGSISTTEDFKIECAKMSKSFNNTRNPQFAEIFPDLVEQNVIDIKKEKEATANASAASSAPRRLVPVDITNGKDNAEEAVDENTNNNDNGGDRSRFSRGQKIVCIAVLVVSWLVASKFFASEI